MSNIISETVEFRPTLESLRLDELKRGLEGPCMDSGLPLHADLHCGFESIFTPQSSPFCDIAHSQRLVIHSEGSTSFHLQFRGPDICDWNWVWQGVGDEHDELCGI
jgi:hypothetical protein